MQNIKFIFGEIEIQAVVRNTPTGNAILEALPIQSSIQPWGEEIYFPVPV